MYADELAATLDDMGVEYAVFQLEEGELGTPHYQGYFILPQKARFTEFKHNLPTAHFKAANGTPAQNREYCTKAEGKLGEFSEIGVFPGTGQGRRTDLEKVHEALKTGLTQAQYADEHFELFVKYPNLVTNYNAAQIRERDGVEEASCTLFIGPPGTGKVDTLSGSLSDSMDATESFESLQESGGMDIEASPPSYSTIFEDLHSLSQTLSFVLTDTPFEWKSKGLHVTWRPPTSTSPPTSSLAPGGKKK